ncbi:MAG: HD domain-containing phosphohydrolase, partial [Thiohalorhabdaceae bacterium]
QKLNSQRRRPGSAICWPIRSGNRIIGALSLNREALADAFSEDEFRQGEKLLRLAAVGVDNLRAQAARERQVDQLQGLVEAQRELQLVDRQSVQTEEAVYSRIAAFVARILDARYAAVGLFNADGSMRAFHTTGMDQATREAIGPIPEGKGLLGDLFRNPQPERINAIHADPRFAGFPEGHPDMHRLVAHPLQRGSRTFGVLYAADRADGVPFTAEDSTYLGMFAAEAADLLDLHRQVLSAVKVFGNLLELRSAQLSGHASRVAERAVAIASRLGLDEGYREDLYIAGLLHDVGMLTLPDSLLGRPYSLLHSRDRKRVRQHPVLGEATLMAMASLDRAARLIRHHHEYIDGSGYPDGLQGEAIPIGARILTVANEFDALMQGTLFVGRMGSEKALEYLCEYAGQFYDRDAVAALSEELEAAGPEREAVADAPEPEPATDRNTGAKTRRKAKRNAPETESRSSGEKRRRTRKGADAETGGPEASEATTGVETSADTEGAVRILESSRLQEGMTLARDLMTEEGVLLLSKGHVLDEALIQKIRYFERRLERRFDVVVQDDRGSRAKPDPG